MQKTAKNTVFKSIKNRLLLIFTPKELIKFHSPFTWRSLLLVYILNNLLLYLLFSIYNYLTSRQFNLDFGSIADNLLNNSTVTLVLFFLSVIITFVYFVILKFSGTLISFLQTALGLGFFYLTAFFYKNIISLMFYFLQQSEFLQFHNWLFVDIITQYALSVFLALYFLALIKANLVNRKKVLTTRWR